MIRAGAAGVVLAVLATAGPAPSAHAVGIDQPYVKPADQQTWGEQLLSYFAIDGVAYDKSYALVIGISEFDHIEPNLPTAEDPHRVKDFLLKEVGFDHVHLLTEDKVTPERVRQLMEDEFPRMVGADDRFLFYWSGHGHTEKDRFGYPLGYLPTSRASRDGTSQMISMEQLAAWDRRLYAKQALYLLDSCFSGHAGAKPQSDELDMAIERMARPARHIVTAGTAEQETIATERLQGSIFTHAVLEGLRGGADRGVQEDGLVSLSELQVYLERRMDELRREARWNEAISPQIWRLGSAEGQFFFQTSKDKIERLAATGGAFAGEWSHGVPMSAGSAAPSATDPTSRDIKEAQEILTALRYDPGPIDGTMGLRTRGALSRFQADRGIARTGDLDPQTEKALVAAWADNAPGRALRVAPSVEAPPAEEPEVAVGLPDPRVEAPERAPLSVFRDCPACPEMVVIPAGSFTMGSPADETGRDSDEGPQRTVTIGSFALARTEVTFDQWEACVDDGECTINGAPGDFGWGRGTRPVIDVSWNDAQEYIAWLNGKIEGDLYRLPTEAEWEYAARAGTTTAYPWGPEASHEFANYGADQCCSGLATGTDQWVNTAPVGQFPPNAFGLHDMHGNVFEWVQDVYEAGYSKAHDGGRAYVPLPLPDSARRVVRGGSWNLIPQFLRSAVRGGIVPGERDNYLGFRPARTLLTR